MLKRSTLKLKVAALSLLIAIGSILGTLGLAGCGKRPLHICATTVVISPDGGKIAIRVGPKTRGAEVPDVIESQAYVVELANNIGQVVCIPDSRAFLSAAWRPNVSPSELFITTAPPEPDIPNRLFAVTLSNGVSTVFSQDLSDYAGITDSLSWSPNGQILAGQVRKAAKYNAFFGKLGISYDNGKNITTTGISMYPRKPVWVNDEVLYIQDKDRIIEVEIRDKHPQFKRIVASGKGFVRLLGSLDGKVVYRLDSDIYCGGQLLYHSNQGLKSVFADGSYVALQEGQGGYVLVLDGEGDIGHKKNIEYDAWLVGFSSVSKFVYLLKDWQSIQRYSFVGDDRMSVVYSLKD